MNESIRAQVKRVVKWRKRKDYACDPVALAARLRQRASAPGVFTLTGARIAKFHTAMRAWVNSGKKSKGQ